MRPKRRQQRIIPRKGPEIDRPPPIKKRKISRMKTGRIFRNNIPKPGIQRSRCSEITGMTDPLPLEYLPHLFVDLVFIHHTIIKVAAAQYKAKQHPKPPPPVVASKDQQGQEGNPQPDTIKRI